MSLEFFAWALDFSGSRKLLTQQNVYLMLANGVLRKTNQGGLEQS